VWQVSKTARNRHLSRVHVSLIGMIALIGLMLNQNRDASPEKMFDVSRGYPVAAVVRAPTAVIIRLT